MTRLLMTMTLLTLIGTGCDVETDLGKLPPKEDVLTEADAGITPDLAPLLADTIPALTPDSTPADCVPDQPQCEDLGSYRVCNSQGTALLAPIACLAGQRCDDGKCVSAGKVTGSMSFYIHVKAKDIYDVDPEPYQILANPSAVFEYDAPGLVGPMITGPERCSLLNSSGNSPVPGTPFDAGDINLSGLPGGNYTLAFDPARQRYDGPSLPPLTESSFPYGQVIPFSSSGKGLVHGAFSGNLTLPPRRLFTHPARRETLTVPKNQALEITWSGATGQGQIGLHITELPDPSHSGPFTPVVQIKCMMDDDGAFSIPVDTMSFYAPYPRLALTMMIDEHQPAFDATGLTESEVVVSYRHYAAAINLAD